VATAYYSAYLLLTPTTTLPTIVVAGLFSNCLFSNFVAFAMMNFLELLKNVLRQWHMQLCETFYAEAAAMMMKCPHTCEPPNYDGLYTIYKQPV
jgi:hypothetical protein